MKVTVLKYTIRMPTEYSFGYVLITGGMSLADIAEARAQGKKLVFFGNSPQCHEAWTVLEQAGLRPDCACDVHCEYAYDNYGVPMRPWWELLADKNAYYFIVTVPRDRVPAVMKMLFYAGIDDFGIVYSGWTKDFNHARYPRLREAVFDAINDVYGSEPFFCNDDGLENLRRTALEGCGWWDVLYMSIYRLARGRQGLRYLEIGTGTGIMSLALKRLLGDALDVSWLNLPITESYLRENRSGHFETLVERCGIKQHFGQVELAEPEDIGRELGPGFDFIVLAQVMEHFVFNPADTFRKLAGLLSPRGMIYVAVPQETTWHNVRSWRDMPSAGDLTARERERRQKISGFLHFHEYGRDEALEVFAEAGLELVQHRWNTPVHFFILRAKTAAKEPGAAG